MLAKLLTGTIDPARLDTATVAVQEELIPGFLAHDGAEHGYWMADPASGSVVAITLWRDCEAVDRAAAADGRERAVIADRIGLRVHAVHVLPVLAAHNLAPSVNRPAIRWVRLTWVEGVAAHVRPRLADLHDVIVEDQSTNSGFCASYWIGDETAGEGYALSFWERQADLTDGALASRRRRRRAERDLQCHIGAVRQYQSLAITHQPVPVPALHEVRVDACCSQPSGI